MKSLQEKAMKVKLAISQWTARKYDRKISNEIDKQYHTHDAGRYNKVLIALDRIKTIHKISQEARIFFYRYTLSWDEPYRLLPSKQFIRFTRKIGEIKNRWETEVQGFISEYPNLIDDAKNRLNGMFNNADYPHPQEIINKFDFNIWFDTLNETDLSDFRVQVSQKDRELIEANIKQRTEESIQQAMKEPWDRLYASLNHLVQRFKDPKAKRLHDSILGNIKELTSLLPSLNIFEDPDLERINQEIIRKLQNSDIDVIRDNESIKLDTANKVEEIMKRMEGYM